MTTDYGYQLPLVIDPESSLCFTIHVPNDLYHIAAFKGQIWELTRWYNWAKDPDHLAIQVAEVWKGIYNRMQTENCCDCPPRIRLNKGILQWQNGDGSWSDLETGDERTSGTATPPYPDNPDGACLAAENITAIYQTALTQVRAGVATAEVAVAIAATVTGIMSLFIAPAIVSTIALAITGIALDVGEAALDTMLDPAHLDAFKCVIYCHISVDGTVTASQYTEMRENMASWASGSELAIIQYWLDGFGSVGLTRQGRAGGITSGDCDDCECGWTRVFLNGAGNVGDIVLTPVDQGAFGNGGIYNATDDRFDSPSNDGVAYHVVALNLDTSAETGFTITRVRMFASGSFVNNGGSNSEWKIQINGTNAAFVSLPQTTPSPHTQIIDTGAIGVLEPNSIYFYVDAPKTEGIPQGYLYINRIEVSGTGVNPFV